MISQLFRKTENFEVLLSHETLVQTLARLMREEMKKSIDLCINVVSVFFSVSNFSQVCSWRIGQEGYESHMTLSLQEETLRVAGCTGVFWGV